MHPAKSVIFFTTASGAGYGLLIWLAVLSAYGLLPASLVFGLVALGFGLGLVTAGLLSSTFHLGHPERAWRALSQWRSSWLSREGVASITAFVPLGLFAICWVYYGENTGLAAWFGIAGAAMSLLTLYTTSMIYASLKPIPAWHNGGTVAGYLVLGPMNGAVILAFLTHAFGYDDASAVMQVAAVGMLVLGFAVKLLYWQQIHAAPAVSTAGSATGLGHLGKVELTASPHDSDNYLLREMGFRIARKHAFKLRWIAIVLAFVVPSLCLLGAISIEQSAIATVLAALAWLSCQIGVTTERWLFFAEAKHAVTLYYGEAAV
ncbi:dimethyl sulfoxide reductase anchor subunit family protein [Tsuneonella mangrovi]|uniref:dimethyl sulfoxide reductase anchor subunit family protein n=1 Tax=Tsuneonella mangrovi TaxID=1982042 RepID=UPI000BA25B35|nr:DmsC/YnfH family molybdoenzyme membrane anchor subunit [Tsuneonella mangrovi]